MEFEWDEAKAAANLAKHEVDFADAEDVLYDVLAMTFRDEHPIEDRFVTMGIDAEGRLLVVVYALRGDAVRIISARHATKHERRKYEG